VESRRYCFAGETCMYAMLTIVSFLSVTNYL
jgi:hypothetical protein